MPLTPGTRLGPYDIVAPIGAGGMGEVYRARDAALGRDAAIKVLPEAFARDPERMARFEREARMLASLNHPHIAAIYGAGAEGGTRFLAMEMVEGDELAALIARGPLPVADAVSIARQIAEALEVAHEKGIIHRDLKPANVKLTADGAVKLLDFGLAKAFEGDVTEQDAASAFTATITTPMTAPNVILGTAAYMSPEQARGKLVDRRADIWAFGAVLFECLTGKRAFLGETASDTLAKILEREPDFAALPSDTPPRVRELLQRCLVKDPKLRLRDIGDARITLDEVLATRAPSGKFAAVEPAPAAAPRAKSPRLVLTLTAIASLALGAVAWRTFGPHAPGPETRCVSVAMPSGLTGASALLTKDGRTLMVQGNVAGAQGDASADRRLFVRDLDQPEFTELTAVRGLAGSGWLYNPRQIGPLLPLAPGSSQLRLVQVAVDGSAPPTPLVVWKDTYRSLIQMKNGDLLFQDGLDSFVRLSPGGGTASKPVKMDAGRKGVSRYEMQYECLPGEHAVPVNVVMYDDTGWHYSVGILDLRTGKVKIVVEDGGNATYLPAGYLVFSRGDALLAVKFDAGRAEAHGTPVAVWNGLSTRYSFFPAIFTLTDDGTLLYRPGSFGGQRQLAVLDAAGKLTPWSSDRISLNSGLVPSPDGRQFACQIASARGIDEIWVSTVDRPGLRRLGTDPNADCSGPHWSPDGTHIAYFRHGGDARDGIYVQGVEGGAPQRIFASESPNTSYGDATWIAGGTAMILSRNEGGPARLAILRLAGRETDASRLTYPLPSGMQMGVEVSNDCRLVAYGSTESGKLQSYVAEVRADGTLSRPVLVNIGSVYAHKWAPDGRTLMIEDDHHTVHRVTVTLGTEVSTSEPVAGVNLEKLGIASQSWTPLPGGRLFVALRNDSDGDATSYNLVLHFDTEVKRRMRKAR